MKYKKFHFKRLIRELKYGSRNSESSTEEFQYVDIVKKAVEDDEIFKNFRSEKSYKDILEHVNEELAKKYYANLREFITHKEILNLCNSISNIGNPDYIEINSDRFNPTSLRYVNVALDIKNKFPGRNFETITEIGPGYGGQALILENFFDIKEYRFVDLPDVNRLIKKFINLHNFKFKSSFSTIDKFNEDTKSDLFISNYAFSELPKKIQKLSIKKIIYNSKSGYMIVNNFYNFSFKFMNIKQYQKNIPGLCIHEEVPNSYIFNKILTFDNIE